MARKKDLERLVIDGDGTRTYKETKFAKHYKKTTKEYVAEMAERHGGGDRKPAKRGKEKPVTERQVWEAIKQDPAKGLGLVKLPAWVGDPSVDLDRAIENGEVDPVEMTENFDRDQAENQTPISTLKTPKVSSQNFCDDKSDSQKPIKSGVPAGGDLVIRGQSPYAPPSSPADELAKKYLQMIAETKLARMNDDPPAKKSAKKKGPKVRLVVSLDSEWDWTKGKVKLVRPTDDVDEQVPQLRFTSDVLNVSYALWSPDRADLEPWTGVMVNQDVGVHKKPGDPTSGFNLRQIIIFFLDQAYQHLGLDPRVKDVDLMLTGFFFGVDLSAFEGFNALDLPLVVKGKHFIASAQPYKLRVHSQALYRKQRRWLSTHEGATINDVPENLQDTIVHLSIRDAGLLAPQGGLATLGHMVGLEKLDTQEDDQRMGHPIGYYKQHMDVYQQECPDRFLEYVTVDALIPLMYMRQVTETFDISWHHLSKVPMTISQIGAKKVQQRLKADPSQVIHDPLTSSADRKTTPLDTARKGYVEPFLWARQSYFGGFNVPFYSGIVYGTPVDTDLTSAYNTNGSLMSKLDYSKPITDDLTKLGADFAVKYDHAIDGRKLDKYLRQMHGYPFITGVVQADVDYPKGTTLTMTPDSARHKKLGHSPAYVLHNKQVWITVIDLIAALEHGAKCTVYTVFVPAQSWDELNAWGASQLEFRRLREKAKAERNLYPKGSPEYQAKDADQILLKLAGNAIYGKAAQSVSRKKIRDYQSNLVAAMPGSSITDPFIAASYTAFTRYLVWHLYDAVAKVYKDKVLPLNITTDGYTFALQPGQHFDFDRVHKIFLAGLPTFYWERLQAIGAKAGFEQKVMGDDETFEDKPCWIVNLRTRFNFTLGRDVIEALGGVRTGTYTKEEIWNALNHDYLALEVKEWQMTSLTEMKYGTKNHRQGVLTDFPLLKSISLGYDGSYKPDKWLPTPWQGRGFTTVPYDTMRQHDSWKLHTKELVTRWCVIKDEDHFDAFKLSLLVYSFYDNKRLDNPDDLAAMATVLEAFKKGQSFTKGQLKEKLKAFKRALKEYTKWPVCPMAIYDQDKKQYQRDQHRFKLYTHQLPVMHLPSVTAMLTAADRL